MADAPHPEVIRLQLPSRLELLSVLDRLCLAVCERMGFDEDVTSHVAMAVLEAGTNAVEHGNGKDASKSFEVRFTLHPDRLEVEVEDAGTGFEIPETPKDITSPEHILDMRGRGIFIMRNCMDTVEWRFAASGTVCQLVKHRASATAAGA